MKFEKTKLEGVYLVEPMVHRDNRGYFMETWREETFRVGEKAVCFVQDNFSRSLRGVIRGLHYQIGSSAQQKLVTVLYGEVLDVAVDLRRGSPSFGNHISVHLSSREPRMVWIPEGFAHGFSVLSEEAGVAYKCTTYYDPVNERGVRWNDPDLKIDWCVERPLLSEKDRQQPLLREVSNEDLIMVNA